MNVALIGFGKAGRALFETLAVDQYTRSIHVYDPAIDFNIDPIISRKENFVFHDSAIDIDSSFDLVVVATPDHLHKEYILNAISLGISCFVEKPLITSKVDLIEFINATNINPETKITTNLILRASPLFVEIRKLFLNGAFGSSVFIEGK